MSDTPPTLDASADSVPTHNPSQPGLLLLFGAGRPATACIPIPGDAVELGREHPAFIAHADLRISRRHVLVRCEHDHWTVTDLDSRNGTFVDGERLESRRTTRLTRVLRIGDSLLVPIQDLGPLQRLGVRFADGRIDGPTSLMTLLAASRAAQLGTMLHITGESGAGKEALARVFHAAGPAAKGPLRIVNCAAIPEGLAERLLFGTHRGAYSGADAEAEGYIQAAHGGTLFLDEIAELPLPVQAKLLRTLETGEVLPLGAVRPRTINLRFCSATHRDLRALVASGRFREDLLYRIAAPSIRVSPLRERPEEIPWLLQMILEQVIPGRLLHSSLVETCLLRPWPGNVRELLNEARSAAHAAASAEATRVEASHLATDAGRAITRAVESVRPTAADQPSVPATRSPFTRPSREELELVLIGNNGSIRATAKHFACERKQIWRWMDKYAIDVPAQVGPTSGRSSE